MEMNTLLSFYSSRDDVSSCNKASALLLTVQSFQLQPIKQYRDDAPASSCTFTTTQDNVPALSHIVRSSGATLALFLFIAFTLFWSAENSFAIDGQLHSISGQLINGHGTIEKLDHVRITVSRNGSIIGRTFTDSLGAFALSFATYVSVPVTDTPAGFVLLPNYPNPFSDKTTLPLLIDRAGLISINIYDMLGRRVRTLHHAQLLAGMHLFQWDGRNQQGIRCSHGIYFARITDGRRTQIRKICLIDGVQSGLKTQSNPAPLRKNTDQIDITVQINDRDLVDTTYVFQCDDTTRSLHLGMLPVHVYPFLRTRPDTLAVMTGEDASDTLDIYFEKPIVMTSSDLELSCRVIADNKIEVDYHNIRTSSVLLRFHESGNNYTSYATVYFRRSPRLDIVQYQFQRGYLGIAYEDTVLVRNNDGVYNLTLLSSPPAGLSYDNGRLFGLPEASFSSQLHFQLIDARNIIVRDSVRLWLREPVNISFNDYTLDIIETYPRDGTHPYSWVDTYTGVTRDLYYKGERIARANPNGSRSCYCCGLTFEDFFRGIRQLFKDLHLDEDINGMTVQDMKYFIHLWFVENQWGDGPGVALKKFGLGDRILSW